MAETIHGNDFDTDWGPETSTDRFQQLVSEWGPETNTERLGHENARTLPSPQATGKLPVG